ncbi:methyl-CpG-binding domain-containing protein 6-like [Solanum verrucosum]|uniref:methyl-CpG-binding domain-containing protein 6-like n=1 Tax=Solanum verrucosum TaxID=315347 RepID=UPI0020D1B8B3|nr:methyl-CpG-binding domain-containing protein 6-like [Solanum verrucosum]
MTKAYATVSFIPPTIVTTDDFYNDGIASDSLLPLGIYIDVELDVRVEITTPNKGDVPIEGKVSDVTCSKFQIKRKITPKRRVNLDRPKWLPENWRFETKVCTGGATSEKKKDRYNFEPVSGSKFRSKDEGDHFLKTGHMRKREKFDLNRDVATPSEG